MYWTLLNRELSYFQWAWSMKEWVVSTVVRNKDFQWAQWHEIKISVSSVVWNKNFSELSATILRIYVSSLIWNKESTELKICMSLKHFKSLNKIKRGAKILWHCHFNNTKTIKILFHPLQKLVEKNTCTRKGIAIGHMALLFDILHI